MNCQYGECIIILDITNDSSSSSNVFSIWAGAGFSVFEHWCFDGIDAIFPTQIADTGSTPTTRTFFRYTMDCGATCTTTLVESDELIGIVGIV